MNRLTLLLVASILYLNGFSQAQLFVLSPVVGDTIDKTEKMDYLLFRDINDSIFKYCYITFSPNQYFINTVTENDSVIISEIDSADIKSYQNNIGKLSEYYSNKAIQDSIKNAEKLTLDSKNLNPNQFKGQLVDEDDKELILDQVRQTQRLQDDAERHKRVLDGNDIFGDQVRAEFLIIKRKKHKKRK